MCNYTHHSLSNSDKWLFSHCIDPVTKRLIRSLRAHCWNIIKGALPVNEHTQCVLIPHPYVALTIRPSSCCKAFSVDLPAIKHIVSLDRTPSGAGVLKRAIILKAHLMTSHFLKSFSTASSLPLLLSVEWRCLSGNSSWSGITGIVSFTAGGLRLSEMETYHIKSKPVVLVWILAAGDMTACSMHGQVPKETGRPTWQPDSASLHFSADIIAVTERLHAVWGTWHCKRRTPHS